MTGFPPELVADSVVTLTSFLGLALFAQVLRMQRPRSATVRRFLFAIHIVAGMLAVRLLQWLTGADWLGQLTFALAGLVPLAALLVVEALMRRHAPLALKVWSAGGAVIFALVAILVDPDRGLAAILSLAVFQLIAFIALAGVVMTRDRQSLSAAENTTIDRLALSLLLIVPLALTDFRTEFLDLPVRLSGIAILTMCWLGLTLRRGEATQSAIISAAMALIGGLVFASLCIAELAALDVRSTAQVMAVILSFGLLGLVCNQARLIRREDAPGRVLDVLADDHLDGHQAFLKALQTKALTSGALILEAEDLTDFDEIFRQHFGHHPIVSSEDTVRLADPALAEQFEWFFRKYAASHAMLVSKSPFRIMALNVPTLAQSGQFEQELQIAQRIAALLAEREALHG